MKLNDMTVKELIESADYRKELQWQIDMEQKHYDEMCLQAVEAHMRLKRAPIARLMERGVFDVVQMIELFKAIICKTLIGYSAAEREYIRLLCMMAYWRVVEQNKEKE